MKSVFRNLTVAVLALVVAVSTLAGCAKGSVKNSHYQSSENKDAKYQIVCTIYPIYDWVTNIVGDNDNVNVTLLLDQGTDLHSFQPTTADMALISEADMFIYVGGESDEWATKAADNAKNKDQKVINLMNLLSDRVVEEEVKEGMQAHDHDHDHEDADEHDHAEHAENESHDEQHSNVEEETEYDEHVWLSLKNAKEIVKDITDEISAMDSDNSAKYKTNSEEYITKLKDLDNRYQSTVDTAAHNTLVFGDRFPFRYMVDDYKLDYYAAFVGCSAETEASFDTISFLAKKVDEAGIKTVITIENSDQKIAKTVIENTQSKDAKISVLNSMQSVTANDVANGITYLSIMEENLSVLKDALN